MAFIDKPEEMTADTVGIALPDADIGVSNSSESEILEWVDSRFQRAKTERRSDEDRWIKSYRNYRGVYDSETQFLEHEQSEVFVKITKTKVLAASAQISDVLFSGSKFPIGIEKSRRVKGVVDSVHFDPKEVSGGEEAPRRSATVTRPEILDGLGPLATSPSPGLVTETSSPDLTSNSADLSSSPGALEETSRPDSSSITESFSPVLMVK